MREPGRRGCGNDRPALLNLRGRAGREGRGQRERCGRSAHGRGEAVPVGKVRHGQLGSGGGQPARGRRGGISDECADGVPGPDQRVGDGAPLAAGRTEHEHRGLHVMVDVHISSMGRGRSQDLC